METVYDLERMDPKTFEQIGVVLARRVLGPGVEAYGDGADGGREATFEGRFEWSNTPGGGVDVWDGYVVIQAKHRSSTDLDPGRCLTWLKKQVRDELDTWKKADSAKRRTPEYIIFVTNARLSPATGGGIETIHKFLVENTSELRAKGLKGWKVWHRDQLVSLLDTYPEVRRHFPSFLTTAIESILSRLESLERRGLQPTRDLLVEHARQGLRYEQWVNFGEVGIDSRRPISQVVVDLPVTDPEGLSSHALQCLLRRGERVLRHSLTPKDSPRHVVLTGAPGNGKSTLSQYLVQLYRAAFLATEDIGQALASISQDTGASLERLRLAKPRQQRWPVRVDMAEWASSDMADRPVMDWVARIVGIRAGQAVHARELRRWVKEWPWLLVFDGLDEVTNLDARRCILRHVADFVAEVDDDDADVLVVVTTRPGGYSDELPREHFSHFQLDYFSTEEAISYGQRTTAVRLREDQDRAKLVLERFDEASKDPATLRLLKTPLQVLIVTVILEMHSRLPVTRYGLFWTYFETLSAREQAKSNDLAVFLTKHQQEVRHVHEVVGLDLQIRAETAANSRATLPLDELRRIADQRFLEIGYADVDDRRRLVGQMVDAATRRLILLVPGEVGDDGSETVAFELRSLQELMAARRVSSGSLQSVKDRLVAMAPSPHWRNTWVFAAGRLFADDDQSRWDLVTDVVAAIDSSAGWPGWLVPTAPGLAAELLDDGLALAKPLWQTRLLNAALSALAGPLPIDIGVVARGLTVAWLGPVQHKLVLSKVQAALLGTGASRYAASRVMAESRQLRLDVLKQATGRLSSTSAPRTSTMVDEFQVKVGARGRNRVKLGTLILPGLADLFDGEIPPAFQAALTELDTVQTIEQRGGVVAGYRPKQLPNWSETVQILTDSARGFQLELAMSSLPAERWPLLHLAARELYPALARRPVGTDLSDARARQ